MELGKVAHISYLGLYLHVFNFISTKPFIITVPRSLLERQYFRDQSVHNKDRTLSRAHEIYSQLCV